MTTINPGLNQLFSKFDDHSRKVREGISWAISKISEVHCEMFRDKQIFDTVINIFNSRITDKPRISSHICKSLENMTEYFSSKENLKIDNLFTPHL
jgi:hypothetical protein